MYPTTQTIVEPFLDILDELETEVARTKERGPTMSDSIYAKLLIHFARRLPSERNLRNKLLSNFLDGNPQIKVWLGDNLIRNRTNLELLLRLEWQRSQGS